MCRYEELFPIDPIGAIEKLKKNYVRYFTTAYKFGEHYHYLNEMKDALLEQEDNLYKEPYLEIQPEYESTGRTLGDLLGLPENQALANALPRSYVDFIRQGLMSYPPYVHQFEMLRKSFLEHKNMVITSGTGSGKTESFLLPLFASLLTEAGTWGPSQYDPNWAGHTPYDDAYQRIGENENRQPALRAMIMYPMNALVDDQLSRLRQALDSEPIRRLMDTSFGGNRIFFGRYNGQTIGKKSLNRLRNQQDNGTEAFEKCAEKLSKIVDSSQRLTERYAQEHWEGDSRLANSIFISPRFPHPNLGQSMISGEMVTRWDMQEFPPDILITNFSMLSIMLMRKDEAGMLEKTRRWFSAEDVQPDQRAEARRHRVFHLIIDELHLYRGTAGTEVGYLLRTFLDRIGVPPTIQDQNGRMVPNPQLRILASSASLEPDSAQSFLSQFFGIYNENDRIAELFDIQQGSDYPTHNEHITVDYSKFRIFAERDEEQGIRYIDDADSQPDIKYRFLHDPTIACETLEDYLRQYANKIYFDFKTVFVNDEGRVVPKSLDLLCNVIFGGDREALRGFLIFRGDTEVNRLSNTYKLPRFRFHQFFKYIEGLWGELIPTENGEQRVIGDVMYRAYPIVERVQGHPHRVLELLRCECCGELYLGGNRTRVGDNEECLSLNSPVLDKVPNRNATPMVENKHYSDYAIFWPNYDVYVGEHINATKTTGETATLREAEGIWERAYLNPFDGHIKTDATNLTGGWIYGYLFKIRNIANGLSSDDFSALPCECPHCNKSYKYRLSTKSPIRSFRTGIKRSNQVLTKELMYQLPREDRKLIGFSDSRQDAAEQAHGIAEEHYRDMVRLLFINTIEEMGQTNDLQTIIDQINGLAAAPATFQNAIRLGVIAQINQSNLPQQLRSRLISIVDNRNYHEANNLALTYRVIPMARLLKDHLGHLNGPLVRKLLGIYMNPSGVDYASQWNLNRQNGNYERYYWSQAYDFATGSLMDPNAPNAPDYLTPLLVEVGKKLQVSVFQNCFGQFMGLSTEEAGLGYVTLSTIDTTNRNYLEFSEFARRCNADPKEFIAAYIRVLGDYYRYDDPDAFACAPWDNYNDYSAACKAPIRALVRRFPGLVENDFGQALHNFLLSAMANQIKLHVDYLGFVRSNVNDHYYKCPRCGRIHLHRGMGICTNTACCAELEEAVIRDENNSIVRYKTIGDLHQNHFISYDIDVEPRAACRMHTEELTGQTDDQSQRLLEFKDIILDEPGEPETHKIDMISVTTTMEVGVDIGSLQAVYQGNMPPTRYNYQQRVGRAGRRKQAFSTVLTFCRGKSHDTYYYYEGTDEITGGKTASPQLAMTPYFDNMGAIIYNEAIIRRVILKHVLHDAYLDCGFTDQQLDVYNLKDTNGEFGNVAQWQNTYRQPVYNWLNNEEGRITAIVNLYLRQFNVDQCLDNYRKDIINWVQHLVINEIDVAIDNTSSNGIAQTLAEAGLLPMYGMPSDMRVLYHHCDLSRVGNGNQWVEEYKSIDRPLEQAITEFAPGAEKMKDHGVYRSAGLTVPDMTRKYRDINDYNNDPGRWDALEHTFWMHVDPITQEVDRIERDDHVNEQEWKQLVIPKAFRTELLRDNMGERARGNSKSGFSQAEIWVSPAQNAYDTIETCNIQLSTWNASGNDHPVIWYINDNEKKYFNGISMIQTRPNNGALFTIYPRFIRGAINANELAHISSHAPNFMVEHGDQRLANALFPATEKSIALGARKVTDMLKLSVRNVPNGICLNSATGYVPAIKAAFYSAATLIQRVFADEMDLQPDEIELSNVQFDENGDPYIYLFDHLINGSGFVKLLSDNNGNGQIKLIEIMNQIVNFEGSFMQSILDDNHREKCNTSCARCLCSYQNAGYHHVLDWRLGVDLIKLMLDENYSMGQNNLDDTPYGDLRNQFQTALDGVVSANPGLEALIVGNNYYIHSVRQTRPQGAYIPIVQDYYEQIVHPLWSHNVANEQNFFELLRKAYTRKEGTTISPVVPQTRVILD